MARGAEEGGRRGALRAAMGGSGTPWVDPSPKAPAPERAGGGVAWGPSGGKSPAKESLRRAQSIYGAAVKSCNPRHAPNGSLTVGPPYTLHQQITLVRGNTSGMGR